MLSCSFPKGVRQGSKHILPSRSCQFTLPFPIDEATGHRHSESCQQRWQWKSSRGSLPFSHPAEQGKRFSHRAGTFGANSDPSMAPPGLAAYCTARAFCNLFRCILTLFSWHCHVRVCSFGGFGGRGCPALSGFVLSFEFAGAEQLATSLVSIRASPSTLETVFSSFRFISELSNIPFTKWNTRVSFITL